MTDYVVAELSIHDPARYGRYMAGFLPTLKPFGGRLLAADTAVEAAEGEWRRDKLVLIAFPDRVASLAWAQSPAYRAIAVDRQAAAEAVVLRVRGLDG